MRKEKAQVEALNQIVSSLSLMIEEFENDLQRRLQVPEDERSEWEKRDIEEIPVKIAYIDSVLKKIF